MGRRPEPGIIANLPNSINPKSCGRRTGRMRTNDQNPGILIPFLKNLLTSLFTPSSLNPTTTPGMLEGVDPGPEDNDTVTRPQLFSLASSSSPPQLLTDLTTNASSYMDPSPTSSVPAFNLSANISDYSHYYEYDYYEYNENLQSNALLPTTLAIPIRPTTVSDTDELFGRLPSSQKPEFSGSRDALSKNKELIHPSMPPNPPQTQEFENRHQTPVRGNSYGRKKRHIQSYRPKSSIGSGRKGRKHVKRRVSVSPRFHPEEMQQSRMVNEGYYLTDSTKEDYMIRPTMRFDQTTQESEIIPLPPSGDPYVTTRNLGPPVPPSPSITQNSRHGENEDEVTITSVSPCDSETSYCLDAPHYVVYSWILCMVALAAFLKLYFLVKATIISMLALTYTILIFLVFDDLFEPTVDLNSDLKLRWDSHFSLEERESESWRKEKISELISLLRDTSSQATPNYLWLINGVFDSEWILAE